MVRSIAVQSFAYAMPCTRQVPKLQGHSIYTTCLPCTACTVCCNAQVLESTRLVRSFISTRTSPYLPSPRGPGDVRLTRLSCQHLTGFRACTVSSRQFRFGAINGSEAPTQGFVRSICFAEYATRCNGPISLASPGSRASSLSYCQGAAAHGSLLLCFPTSLLALTPGRSTSERHIRSAKPRLVALLCLRAASDSLTSFA